jgi:hypothetical protein
MHGVATEAELGAGSMLRHPASFPWAMSVGAGAVPLQGGKYLWLDSRCYHAHAGCWLPTCAGAIRWGRSTCNAVVHSSTCSLI